MPITVRQAEPADVETVRDVLAEAARWLERKGEPLWDEEHYRVEDLVKEVEEGVYFVAESGGKAVGVVRFQLTDELFWPDVPEGESAFIHRLAVTRSHAGGAVSSAILSWAARRASELGLRYLRLDCAPRPKLRAVYERFGFRFHSMRDVEGVAFQTTRYEYPLDRASER